MKTQLIRPPLAIAHYVREILVIESYDSRKDFVLPLYANGSPTLVFQTARSFRQDQSIGHLTLYGQTIQPGELLITEDFLLIAYFFYPYALRSLFGIRAWETVDKYVELDSLKHLRAAHLQEQLLNASSLSDRLELINKFIIKRAGSDKTDDQRIVFATREILNSNGLYSLIDLRGELNVSERTFQRFFHENIGIAPKVYSKICRFQSAFQQLNSYRFSKLSDLAYANGFADQSHFIRVFKEFTGLTPKEYLAKSAPYNPRF